MPNKDSFNADFLRAIEADVRPGQQLPTGKKSSPAPAAQPQLPGLQVILAVRKSPLGVANETFSYQSKTILKWLARIEAERAAKEAGWRHIAYVQAFIQPDPTTPQD